MGFNSAFKGLNLLNGPQAARQKYVEVWRMFLFTPVACTVEGCLAAGPLKVRASLWSQNGPLQPLNPSNNHYLLCQDIATTPLSHLTNTSPDIAHFVYRSHWNRKWVQYQHWPMRRAIILDQKGFQWRIVVHIFQTKLTHKNRCLQLQEGPQTCLL